VHLLVFFAIALICLGITLLPLVRPMERSQARRVYWGGTAAAMIFAFLALLPDWVSGVVFAAAVLVGMTIGAYFTSPYITIAGKVRAFHTYDSQPDRPQGAAKPVGPTYTRESDEYGTGVTAAKMWWLLVPAMALCSGYLAVSLGDGTGLRLVILAAAAVVLIAFAFGYLTDGSWGYRVARGQYPQFVLIALLTAGVFALVYLPAYAAGRQWPLRTKKSLERPAPPRSPTDKKPR
jgi:hypothetical protein